MEAEARRTQLKNLIILGKERGFLTYAEINDHLPDEVLDADQIEGVISMINDMGIQVYDEAPDAETLLMQDATPAVADEDVVAEAEQALTTVDSEFGRTTDPVRMYMREMGSVDLLTREGEIEIAKRIEEGLRHMVQAISSCPLTIQQILDMATQVEKDELRIDELIDGFVEIETEPQATVAEEDTTSEDDEADEDDEDASAAVAAANLAQLKAEALAQFDFIRKAYKKAQTAQAKYGLGSPQHMKAQAEVTELLMAFRFSVRQVDRLCEQIRNAVEEVRSHERKIMEFCVTRSGMPRPHFIKAFPGNETNLSWLDREICRQEGLLLDARQGAVRGQGAPGSAHRHAGSRRPADQEPEGHQQADVHRRSQGTPRQTRNDRGQPAPGDLDRQEVHQPRPAVPRPDPGRQHRPDEGGGQVRIPPRLQVLDLRHLVDPPGDHPLDRRPGAHHPHPGAHDRDHQQDEPHQPPDPAGNGYRARSGRRWR